MSGKQYSYFLIAVLGIFFIDVCLCGFFEQQIAYLLLAYCVTYMILTDSYLLFCLLAGAVAIESVLLYGHYGIVLLYAIPIILGARKMIQVVNAPMAICAASISGIIWIQLRVIDSYLLKRGTVSIRYTMISIGVTLVLSLLFFLKFRKR